MKILFYSNKFVMGGMENAVYSLASLLNQQGGYEFTFLADEWDNATERMASKYRSLGQVCTLSDGNFESDILVNCSPFKFILPNVKANRTIFWVHTCQLGNIKDLPYRRIVISQSEWHKREIEKIGVKSQVITNVLDEHAIRKLANEPITLPIPEGSKMFLIVARLSPEKGWERAIEFMRRKRNLNHILVVLGGAYGEKGKAIKERLIQILGNRVWFLGETLNPYPYIKRCDYLCSFSDTETYGITTEEAHILGRPAIFNHYPTANDQFIEGFDQWIDKFDENIPSYNFTYSNNKNVQSLCKWQELFHYKKTDSENKVDFYASKPQYFDHIAPVYLKLPERLRGKFYIYEEVIPKAEKLGIKHELGNPRGGLTLVASYTDYQGTNGDIIFMEHGIGHTYSNGHPAYAGGSGKDRVVLFLNQHQLTQEKNEQAYPATYNAIIGTPKLDSVIPRPMNEKKVVCLSFHWDCYVCPETRSSFEYYKRVIPYLAQSKDFKLVMHGHPRSIAEIKSKLGDLNLTFYDDFDEVMKIADVYVNDNSSTMYEFLLTGRPVVVLNDTQYRKHIHHGIRFWDYIPGIQVDRWTDLERIILKTLEDSDEWKKKRAEIVATLYPFLGQASKRASQVITDFIEKER